MNAATRENMVAVDGAEASLLVSPPVADPASCPPLEALVARLELEHPHFPVRYGGSDPSFTGGPGVDWKPVPRESGSNVTGLPMTALLSQALVALRSTTRPVTVDRSSERRTSCGHWTTTDGDCRGCRPGLTV